MLLKQVQTVKTMLMKDGEMWPIHSTRSLIILFLELAIWHGMNFQN